MKESDPVPLAQLLKRVAARGDSAREKLARWSVAVGPGSRLELASKCLREAAAAGHVDASREAVSPVLRALWVAADFADIADYLPESRVKSIRKELSAALVGDLWPDRGSRSALQLQTQHWIGAVLLHAGVEIEHAIFSAKRPVKIPEFFFRDGSQRVGVEVKRPESRRRIETLVSEAMGKFHAHDCYGAIMLEITDCIDARSPSELSGAATEIMGVAHATVWDDARDEYKPGFQKLIYLGGVVRGAWEVPAEDVTRLRIMGHALHQGYTDRPGTLQGLISGRFQVKINTAFDGVIDRLTMAAVAPDV